MLATALPEDLYDARLGSVLELLFTPSDDSGSPMREAVALRLGDRSLIVRALTDTSELQVSLGELVVEKPEYLIRNASEDEHFSSFIGKSLRNWWVAHNDRGYADAFMVAFEVSRGLCFVAMNNTVSVLTVAGEQWS
jgi:Family of unknown function (DUF6334)